MENYNNQFKQCHILLPIKDRNLTVFHIALVSRRSNRGAKCDVMLLWQQISGVSNLYHETWPFLFLSAIMCRKVIHVNFFIFFCYVCMTMLCWAPDIWLPWQCDVTTSPLYFTGVKLSLNGPKGVFCFGVQLFNY